MSLVLDDTIAAIATAPGAAGLAVVRLSGRDALAVADRVFRGRSPLASAGSHTLHHGWVIDGGSRIDEIIAAVFRAPHSYTREDVVELSCHGGALPSRRVLTALMSAGARLAGPGEFTLRAFLNGRLDLAQAEAVADVIAAATGAAHDRQARRAGRGGDRRNRVVENQRHPASETTRRRTAVARRLEKERLRYSSGSVVSACAGATARRLIIPSPIA